MQFNLKIPDELFEVYVKNHGIPVCYQYMKRAIEAYKDIKKDDRVLLIGGDYRRDLENTFQTILDTPEKLCKLARMLNTVRLFGVDVQFDEEELGRLDVQATFLGITRDELIKNMVTEIKDRMLEKV